MKVAKNPLSVWAKWFVVSLYLEFTHRKKKLQIGSGTKIRKSTFGLYNTIGDDVSITTSTLGDFTYVGMNSKVSFADVGKFCSIGKDVKIGMGGMHPSSGFVSTHPIFYSLQKQAQITFADKEYFNEYKKTIIGNDVWIGSNALIMDGCIVNTGAIVAAGSVVTADVPAYAIVGGVPAKVIKFRFEENQIKTLMQSSWWEKDPEWLKKNFRSFHSIETFREIDSTTE